MQHMFKRDELKLLWPFYLHALIHGLSIMILPFFIIYFLDLGLSFLQVYIMTTASNIAVILFEIPTGAFADGYSRKYSTIWGFALIGCVAFLFGLITNFYLLTLLWLFYGIGMTFISGAYEAWVVDNLRHEKRNDLQEEYFIKSQSLIAMGVIVSPLVGALVAKLTTIKILWFVMAFGFMIGALVLAVAAKEHYRPKKISIKKAVKENFENAKRGIQFTKTHKTVFLLTLTSVFVALILCTNDAWQPLLVNLGLERYALGIVYSIFGGVLMIAPFISRYLSKFKYKNAFTFSTVVWITLHLSLLFIVPPYFIPAVLIYLMSNGATTAIGPMGQKYLHKFIPTKIRATVVSVKQMASQLTIAIAGIIAAAFMDKFGPQVIVALSSLFGIFAIITIRKIKD